jgi:hypothetical protein
MLETITPVRFHAAVTSGRTRPARVECEKTDGTLVEVVAKFAGGCDRGEIALAIEVVAACLAADLGLPIPTPYLLSIDPAWIGTIPDATYRGLVARSGRIAYGSTDVGSDYRVWTPFDRVTPQMMPVALAIFCFDAFINNADRRDDNPNCFMKDQELRIFDHELAFIHKGILSWQEPWKMGAVASFALPGRHIFYAKLKGEELDTGPVRTAWAALSDERLTRYKNSVPTVWSSAGPPSTMRPV